MKKLRQLFVLLLAFFVVLQSCQQDKDMTQTQTDPTTQKILNFKQKLGTTQKSTETMSLDSAVWYVEAALNYTYDKPNNSEIVEVDSVFITISVSHDKKITFHDISTAYYYMEQMVIDGFSPESENKLNLQFADVSITDTTENTITLMMVAAGSGDLSLVEYFGITDYWRAWGSQGKCSQYGGNYGRDATTEFTRVANNHRYVPGGTGYYPNICTGYHSNAGHEGYFWWDGGQGPLPQFATCLSPDEMNYWIRKLLILGHNQAVTYNLVILNYDVDWESASH